MACRVIELGDIPLGELKPHRVRLVHRRSQDHCRWVFRGGVPDAPGIFYYKIWNPTYVRRDNLPAAIDAGFYRRDLVPALHALIFHGGLCRGYVMREGILGYGQPSDEFRERLFARTRETGWYCVQFAAHHTMLCDGRLSLLDLEGVYSLRDLPRLLRMSCVFDDLEYMRFVCELYRREPGGTALPDPLPEMAVATPAELARLARSRRLKRKLRLARRIARRLRLLVPRTDLIRDV